MEKRKSKKITLGQTRERRCESGEQCNHYFKCYNDKGHPTDSCAIEYCVRYAGENDEEGKATLREQVMDIISNFQCYEEREDDYGDDGTDDVDDIYDLDGIITELQDFWYNNIQDNKRVTKNHKKCFEMALRLLELLQ